MKDAEQALFGLMAVAEEQQGAVRDALAGLVAQREALDRQEARLEGCAAMIQTEVARLRRAVDQVGPGLALATRGAATQAVEQGLAGAGRTATAAVAEASRPMLERLEGVAAQAGAVEASLKRIVAWASWRLLGWGVVVVGCLAGLLWLAHLSVWWWAERDIRLLQAQRSLLQSEIVGLENAKGELEAGRAALEKAGALAKLTRCGTGAGRLCIRVDPKAEAYGTAGEQYRVIQGY